MKRKHIIIALVVIAALAIIYFLFIRKKPQEGVDNSVFPLKKGSKGQEVKQLQAYLVTEYGAQFPKFGVDGSWGDETDANVQKFLKRDNISQTVFYKWGLDKIKV